MTNVSMRDDDYPGLDPNKVRDVDAVIAGFKNLVATHGYTHHHSQTIFVHSSHWLFGGALVATLTVSSVTDHIAVDKILNPEISDKLRKEGFLRREISFTSPLSAFFAPHAASTFCQMYHLHEASFQGGVGFLEKLDKTLSLIGGKRRPEPRNHKRLHL